MSHVATTWAIQQRGLKPATKIVLFHLADRHNPDYGCFPSQEQLANDCEMSRSSLNEHLKALEMAGLIARQQRRHDGSKRQESTRYVLGFEKAFVPVLRVAGEGETGGLCPESGHGFGAEAVSENGGEPCPDFAESRVQNPDSNLVREPVRETVTERESASADETGKEEGGEPVASSKREYATRPGTAAMQRRVARLCNGDGYKAGPWPKWAEATAGYITRHFEALSEADRQECERWRDTFLAKCVADGVKKPMPIGNFIRDRAWTYLTATEMARGAAAAERAKSGIADGGAPASASASRTDALRAEGWAPARGPVWAAALFDALVRGPDRPERAGPSARLWLRVHLTASWPKLAQLSEMRGAIFPPAFHARRDDMEFVPRGGMLWDPWMDEFHARNWPLMLTNDWTDGGYFPKGGPQGIDQFHSTSKQEAAE